MQSKKLSIVESISNVGTGYFIALGVQLAIFPVFDIEVKFAENMIICGVFTVISICRGYIFRRLFNWIEQRRRRNSLRYYRRDAWGNLSEMTEYGRERLYEHTDNR